MSLLKVRSRAFKKYSEPYEYGKWYVACGVIYYDMTMVANVACDPMDLPEFKLHSFVIGCRYQTLAAITKMQEALVRMKENDDAKQSNDNPHSARPALRARV